MTSDWLAAVLPTDQMSSLFFCKLTWILTWKFLSKHGARCMWVEWGHSKIFETSPDLLVHFQRCQRFVVMRINLYSALIRHIMVGWSYIYIVMTNYECNVDTVPQLGELFHLGMEWSRKLLYRNIKWNGISLQKHTVSFEYILHVFLWVYSSQVHINSCG